MRLIRTLRLPALFFATALILVHSPVSAAPTISNLTASQRNGTKLVDIAFDLSAPGFSVVTVSLEISGDGGATWTVPSITATGDIGAEITPGSAKTIVWDAGTDWPDRYSSQMRFRVVADDGVPDGFAHIPEGSFLMGGDGLGNAPLVSVTVSGFYMAETETTKAKWDEVRAWGLANGYTDLPAGQGKGANHPVQTVNWYDVVKWCNASSEREGLTPCYTVGGATYRTGVSESVVCNWSARGYRLPTEAEWEKAARGGASGKRFPWGTDTISHARANYWGFNGHHYDESPINDYHPTYKTGSIPYTCPVGSFPGNGYGIREVAGNVSEWCWDRLESSYYRNNAVNPRGPETGLGRVIRGDAYGGSAAGSRCAARGFGTQSGRNSSVGFRVARG